MKNKLQKLGKSLNNTGELGQGLIQFLISAIVVAILLYVLLVVVKALFFS